MNVRDCAADKSEKKCKQMLVFSMYTQVELIANKLYEILVYIVNKIIIILLAYFVHFYT